MLPRGRVTAGVFKTVPLESGCKNLDSNFGRVTSCVLSTLSSLMYVGQVSERRNFEIVNEMWVIFDKMLICLGLLVHVGIDVSRLLGVKGQLTNGGIMRLVGLAN